MARSRANGTAGHHDRGARFRPCGLSRARSTLLRGGTTAGPVRAGGLLHRSTLRLVRPCGFPRTQGQDASKSLLQPTFHVTSTRASTPPSETARRAPWETRRRSASRPPRGTARFRSPSRDGAGPPRGHPASDGSALDGASPASGRPAFPPGRAGARGGGESAAASSADGSSAGSNPLAPLRGDGGCAERSDAVAWARSRRRTSMRPAFPDPRCLPSCETSRAPFQGPVRSAVSRWPAGQPPHAFIAVRKQRLGPSSLALRLRFPGRVRSSDFCKWTLPRARPRTARTSRPPGEAVGTAVRLVRGVSSWNRGQPPKTCRVRGRENRISALPSGIAPARDLAPTPIASGTSCREQRPLPCLERRGERTVPPPPHTTAGRARRKGRATPDLREESRRSPTRGAFHRRAIRAADGERGAQRTSRLAPRGQRLFHHPENRARDARTISDGSASSTSESSKLLCCRRAAAPPTTSAFE